MAKGWKPACVCLPSQDVCRNVGAQVGGKKEGVEQITDVADGGEQNIVVVGGEKRDSGEDGDER